MCASGRWAGPLGSWTGSGGGAKGRGQHSGSDHAPLHGAGVQRPPPGTDPGGGQRDPEGEATLHTHTGTHTQRNTHTEEHTYTHTHTHTHTH